MSKCRVMNHLKIRIMYKITIIFIIYESNYHIWKDFNCSYTVYMMLFYGIGYSQFQPHAYYYCLLLFIDHTQNGTQ